MSIKSYISKHNPFNIIKELKEQLDIAMAGILRPKTKDMFGADSHVYPYLRTNLDELYMLSRNSDVLLIIRSALRRELFRNGYDIIESENTSEEVTTSGEDMQVSQQDFEKSKQEIIKFFDKCNTNCQGILDVFEELEDDFSVADNAYGLLLFDYHFSRDGKVIKRELKEFIRSDPRRMGLYMNDQDRFSYDNNGVRWFVCPVDRSRIIEESRLLKNNIDPITGYECFPVFYFHEKDDGKIYYAEHEIVFRSKYNPTRRGGFSPIISCYYKVKSLIGMDDYIQTLYVGKRPPKAGLFFKTNNLDSLEKEWNKAIQRAKENPHMPTIMATQDPTSGKSFVEFIDFMKPLAELQFIETREEFRRVIGAVYGVSPVFSNDVSSSGGLNNEGLQITVTNRAIEYGQAIYNKYFLKRIVNELGFYSATAILAPSEEQDQMARLERQSKSLANGKEALLMGLDVEYDDNQGESIIKGGKMSKDNIIVQSFNPDQGNKPNELEQETNSASGSPDTDNIEKGIKKSAPERVPFTALAKYLKTEINKFIVKYKKKPTESELQELIVKLNNDLARQLKSNAGNLFRAGYIREMEKAEGVLGFNLTFDSVDENAINVLTNSSVLTNSFSKLSNDLTQKVSNILTEAYYTPQGLNLQKIQKEIEEVTSLADWEAERIARTEMSKVSASARKTSYDKEEGDLYVKHIGPDDYRTTAMSKELKQLTSEGVLWKDYLNLMKQVVSKYNPKWIIDENAPITHPNTRHLFVKVYK
jgi:hypothetical protein